MFDKTILGGVLTRGRKERVSTGDHPEQTLFVDVQFGHDGLDLGVGKQSDGTTLEDLVDRGLLLVGQTAGDVLSEGLVGPHRHGLPAETVQ